MPRLLCFLITSLVGIPLVQSSEVNVGPGAELVVRQFVAPEYSEFKRVMMIQGVVRAGVSISPSGTVEKVEILDGNRQLAESAEEALRQWTFKPPDRPVELVVRITFALRGTPNNRRISTTVRALLPEEVEVTTNPPETPLNVNTWPKQ